MQNVGPIFDNLIQLAEDYGIDCSPSAVVSPHAAELLRIAMKYKNELENLMHPLEFEVDSSTKTATNIYAVAIRLTGPAWFLNKLDQNSTSLIHSNQKHSLEVFIAPLVSVDAEELQNPKLIDLEKSVFQHLRNS